VLPLTAGMVLTGLLQPKSFITGAIALSLHEQVASRLGAPVAAPAVFCRWAKGARCHQHRCAGILSRRIATGRDRAELIREPHVAVLAAAALLPVACAAVAVAAKAALESCMLLVACALLVSGLGLHWWSGVYDEQLCGEEATVSDFLETLPQASQYCDEATQAVQLVSLGSYCGPKATFKHIGRGAAHMPFDWMRTRLEGIMQFIETDFDGFFEYVTKVPVPGEAMVLYRSRLHSFWHDDPTSPAMHEKFRRRIERFNAVDASSSQVLFVRAAACTSELSRAPELLGLLQRRFGEQAHLLLILDHQDSFRGSITLDVCPQLMVHFQASKALDDAYCPYNDPVKRGLDWVIGRDCQAVGVRCLEDACKLVDPGHIPIAYGVRIFEAL